MQLRLVEIFAEADPSVLTFVWQPEQTFAWQPGQYIKYSLTHDNPDNRGTTRFFTIAAPPYEGRPRITTRFAVEKGSSFKSALRVLKPGATIEATRPMGGFTFDTTRPAVLVAGGIGITPYRAILLQLDHDHVDFRAHLLYANRTEQYVFGDQLDAVAARQPDFAISYFTDPKHIELADMQAAGAMYEKPLYYLSGPEPMVQHFESLLTQAGIAAEDIKTDYFPGYQ